MRIDENKLRDGMNRRLSTLTASPARRARIRERIALEEEPNMKKKLSLGMILALALTLLTVTALAAGLLLSPKMDALKAADQALSDAYGVTMEMQTYFTRSEEIAPDGTITVTYKGREILEYVLGEYTVTVKDGKAQSVAWSHDGEDTSLGFESEAWGKDQLAEMLVLNQRDQGMDAFEEKADAIARKHGRNYDPERMSEEEAIAWAKAYEARQAEAHRRAKLSEQELVALARRAVASAYDLTPEQEAMLEYYGGDIFDDENTWYSMWEDKPVFEAQFFLTQDPDPNGWNGRKTFVEKDGTYAVLVNVETGVIEELYYESGLGGNG